MAFAYTARAWQLNDLPSATAKYVFLCLADTANPDGYCWPKLATIAAKVQLSVRTVQRHLRALEQIGVLRREARYHRKYTRANLSNGYWLNLDFEPAAAPTPPPVTLSLPECQLVTPQVTPCLPFEPAIAEPIKNEATAAIAPTPTPAHVDAPACEAEPVIHMADTSPQPEPVAPVAVAALPSASVANIETTKTPDDPLADVAPEVLSAFNAVRQAKKQPLLNRFVAQQLQQEATRAGLTLTQALAECVSRHWARFKADWLHAYAAPANAAKATSASASTHASTASPAPRPAALDPHTPEGQQWLQTSFRAQQQALQALPRFTGEDAWAHTAIEKRRRGLQVSQHILQAACQLLRLCPRTLQTL